MTSWPLWRHLTCSWQLNLIDRSHDLLLHADWSICTTWPKCGSLIGLYRSVPHYYYDSFFILPQIIYFTLNNIHFLWYLILGPWFQFSRARGEASQKKGNSFNIFSAVVDQIRSKRQNSKHALHWSCLLLNSTWLKPKIWVALIEKWNCSYKKPKLLRKITFKKVIR